MIRLTHSQTTAGPLAVTDIDDGLPNKTAHSLTAPPGKDQRDGSVGSSATKGTQAGVNQLKQKCYVPRVKAGTALAGYIDLKETDRVLMSVNKGVIAGLKAANLLTVTSFQDSDVAAPTVTSMRLDLPGAGDITITGTNLTSLAPDLTSVAFTGSGAVTLTQTQITGGGGTVGATSIVIPAALVPGVADTATFGTVTADNQTATGTVALVPTLATAVLGGTLVLTGTRMTSVPVTETSVVITGTGAVTLTQAQIVAGGGSVALTSIVIPLALIPGVAITTSSAQVRSNGLTSAVVAVS